MSEFLERIAKLPPQRLALLAAELHERLEASKASAREPIAIVGIGCRFPGDEEGPEGFWRFLQKGGDAITEVPGDRWDVDALFHPDPDHAGTISTRYGGFLRNVDRFDAEFFGISPREAMVMDPQQRLFLEVSWEAFEHAGIPPARLMETRTGVFVGICNVDYALRALKQDLSTLNAYYASGNSHSVASGRLSYLLGLRGPSLSVDTACSSSLVALHLACQSLRSGESDLALAAGVNLLLSPETTVALSRAHMMAPDGRCKAFDAAADGFIRSEGCGVIVLKRLQDAQRDGDRVLALIRGSAANQDGKSSGLTAPNGPSQEAVIREALANAGVRPEEIGYVEAHGTGTSLGDPIEMRALGAVFNPGRPADRPLLVGSVKTNIGHLESAAGIAGIIKVVLSLMHGALPPHLHFHTPNPHIEWNDLRIAIPTEGTAWTSRDGIRRAGVSSFGFSGTNAHVILEEARQVPVQTDQPGAPRVHMLPLSARTPAALLAVGGLAKERLAGADPSTLRDVCWSTGVHRSHYAERAAILARTPAECLAGLDALQSGAADPHVVRRETTVINPRGVVFLCTGQGAQYPGMGRELYEAFPVFRQAIDRCESALQLPGGRRLHDLLWGAGASQEALDQTAMTQPALFSLEYALAEQWMAWGLLPGAVVGHSIGEYVAACIAGVFTVEDALKLVSARGRLMQALPAGGVMAAVFAAAASVEQELLSAGGRVSIAAINAPENCVISGEEGAVKRILDRFESLGISHQRLAVSHAFHSPLMEPMLEEFLDVVKSVQLSPPRIALVSNVTGALATPELLVDAAYWRDHIRRPVHYCRSVQGLLESGYRTFLEIGPGPTLIGLGRRIAEGTEGLWLSSMRKGKEEVGQLLSSAASLYVHGAEFDWQSFPVPKGGRFVDLPRYPFQRKSFWLEESAPRQRTERRTEAGPRRPASLRGTRVDAPVPLAEIDLGFDTYPPLREHHVFGVALVPGTVFLALAEANAELAYGRSPGRAAAIELHAPLGLPTAGTVRMHIAYETRPDGELGFRVYSQELGGDREQAWRLHASGSFSEPRKDAGEQRPRHPDLVVTEAEEMVSGDEFYAGLAGKGFDFGEPFRGLHRLWRAGNEAVGVIEIASADASTGGALERLPLLLDAALQVLGKACSPLLAASGQEVHALLTGIHGLTRAENLAGRLWCSARAIGAEGNSLRGILEVMNERDEIVLSLPDVRLSRVSPDGLRRAVRGNANDWFYTVRWEEKPALVLPLAGAVEEARAFFGEISEKEHLARYGEMVERLAADASHHLVRALSELGVDLTPGRSFEIESTASQAGIRGTKLRLFRRLLAILAEDGVLGIASGRATVKKTLPPQGAKSDKEQRSADGPERRMLERCATGLAGVVRGTVDPVTLLFPNGSFADADEIYSHSPSAKTFNPVLARMVRSLLESGGPSAKVRILEVGAGTGGTTTFVLPGLPAERVAYTFTDVSPVFLARAKERFSGELPQQFKLLDIEKSPGDQGFSQGEADIVIAANVLHATADLHATMRHVRWLLRSGGALLLLEGIRPDRWVDFTFGLTDGWWRFTDESLRADYPLLDHARWTTLLEETGFGTVSSVPEAGEASPQQALLVAQAVTAPATGMHDPHGPEWLLVSDQRGVADAVERVLRDRGSRVSRIGADRLSGSEGLPLPGSETSPLRVVYLPVLDIPASDRLDEAAIRTANDQAVHSLLPLVRSLANTAGRRPCSLWIVTSGAQSPLPGPGAVNPAGSTAWGLGRVIALEHPDLWGGIVDVDPGMNPQQKAATILEEVGAGDGEDQVVRLAAHRWVPRLDRARRMHGPALRITGEGSYLITGGWGGLGLKVAHWLALQGARDLVLVGRTAVPLRASWPDVSDDRRIIAVRAIEALGARVHPVAADIADAQAVRALFQRFGTDLPNLRGIVHAAAGISAHPVVELTPRVVDETLLPKTVGTWLLHEESLRHEIDFFLLFSSTTALLGATGLGHYAAANAFLDSFAAYRGSRGLPALSINWGTWDEMRRASEGDRTAFASGGMLPMPADDALEILGGLGDPSLRQAIVASVNWSVLKPLYETRRRRPFLEAMSAGDQSPQEKQEAPAQSAAASLDALPPHARWSGLERIVRGEVARVLQLENAATIDADQGLFAMGMDSLMSVELKSRLERAVGKPLPATLTFNYPSVAALIGFLGTDILGWGLPGTPTSAATSPAPHAGETVEATEGDETEEELAAQLARKLKDLQ